MNSSSQQASAPYKFFQAYACQYGSTRALRAARHRAWHVCPLFNTYKHLANLESITDLFIHQGGFFMKPEHIMTQQDAHVDWQVVESQPVGMHAQQDSASYMVSRRDH
jgi:hypothetical protein